MVLQDLPSSAFPKTPEMYYYLQKSAEGAGHLRFPPEARRPLAGGTQRCRAPPPAPLSLDSQYHPAAALQLPSVQKGGGGNDNGQTLQPQSTQEMQVPKSPTPSSASSLSLYSAESAKKSFPIGVIQEEEEEEERRKGGGFCSCFSASPGFSVFHDNLIGIILLVGFKALFGIKSKSKPNSILTFREPLAKEPAPAPQMVQTRRRPPPLAITPIDR